MPQAPLLIGPEATYLPASTTGTVGFMRLGCRRQQVPPCSPIGKAAPAAASPIWRRPQTSQEDVALEAGLSILRKRRASQGA
ncbi:hypothetical protein NDU88_005892 [Pleurodeles waltl]|uniref:Uncharacterized protein n=1 Tax=Pleurodeles waltl TaxID=8319 RepID=A0AAV7W932_PLEWA|nr:hypothetical protein NDU88_005892 [Pleurodeles waltl]